MRWVAGGVGLCVRSKAEFPASLVRRRAALSTAGVLTVHGVAAEDGRISRRR